MEDEIGSLFVVLLPSLLLPPPGLGGLLGNLLATFGGQGFRPTTRHLSRPFRRCQLVIGHQPQLILAARILLGAIFSLDTHAYCKHNKNC